MVTTRLSSKGNDDCISAKNKNQLEISKISIDTFNNQEFVPAIVTPENRESIATFDLYSSIQSNDYKYNGNVYQYVKELVRKKVLKESPGATFGQIQVLVGQYWQKISINERMYLERLLDAGELPDFKDFLTWNETPKERKLILFEALHYFFENNLKFQKKWWNADIVLEIMARYSDFPLMTLFDFGLRQPFEKKDIIESLKVGLGNEISIGSAASDFNIPSNKNFFVFKTRSRQSQSLFIYVDLSQQEKVVPSFCAGNTQPPKITQQDYLPVACYELVNPWFSNCYEEIFGVIDGETAREAVENQYNLLVDAANDEDKMRTLIDGFSDCTWMMEWEFQNDDIAKAVQYFQRVSLYIAQALKIVLDIDGETQQLLWKQRCAEAVQKMNDAGIKLWTDKSGNPVREWFSIFRQKRVFPNPLLQSKRYGPPILIDNAASVSRLRQFGNSNLENLTTDMMRDHIITVELKKIVMENDTTIDEIKKQYRLTTISRSTVYNWMIYMGFRQSLYQKGYYTDIHNDPKNVAANLDYCIQVLSDCDIRSACWVQLTLERAQELQSDGKIMKNNNGYRYVDTNNNNLQMVEYHVDDIEKAQFLPELNGIDGGGFISVRKPPKSNELMCWGHDECVAHEKAMHSIQWNGSKGEQPLLPKDLGTSNHISAVTNCQAGWQPIPTQQQLDIINKNRHRNDYLAKEEAISIYGTSKKHWLELDNLQAFVWTMKPGANRDGYWNLAHMAIQFENLCDVCKPSWQKNGWARYSFNECRMGGMQLSMEKTTICLPKTLHGPLFHNPGVRKALGEQQHFNFIEEDAGPYWLSLEEQVATKYDSVETKTRTLCSKKEIAQHITKYLETIGGRAPDDLPKKSMQTLKTLAKHHNILLKVTEQVTIPGWCNAPKGMQQILAERGLIDTSCHPKLYKKAYMQSLLRSCEDFKNEKCLLEWIGELRKWKVIFSAKGYPDVAGFGIEYVWAVGKGQIKRVPLSSRKGAEKFDGVFQQSFSDQVITKAVVRGCAKKACQYMQAYVASHAEQAQLDLTGFNIEEIKQCLEPVSYSKLEKQFRQIQTHQSVADMHGKEVRMIVTEAAETI